MSFLRLDWCARDAALYAVKNWHYSRSLSSAKNVYIGVWEHDKFSGVVVFGIGSGAATDGRRFGLARVGEVAELTRMALKPGHQTPVSRVMSIAVRMLRLHSPGLRMLISFADPEQGHHGGIYQAANWLYLGETKPDVQYQVMGKWVHHRTATSLGSAAGLPSRKLQPKHRYVLPLDEAIRQQLRQLARPYPKRASEAGNDPARGTAAVQR